MGGGGHRVGGDSKFTIERFGGRRRAKAFHSDESAVVAEPAWPQPLDGGFDADTGRLRLGPPRDSSPGCAAKSSKQGAETTAARISLSASAAAASTARETSEPVAISVTSRGPIGSLTT